ncbi:MAG TPA: [protein-PII] uridylyltransferase [Rhodocyclaceae bacterium]|nr:[protein-PII] uridylyltransferase [Rhodocyclaceae bacterium]
MTQVARDSTPAPDLVKQLRCQLQTSQKALREHYESSANARAMLHGRAKLVDGVLQTLWHAANLPSGYALVAVGGYGRGELYPASDVDILILVPDDADPASEALLEQLIGQFWDIGLEIGHSVRSIGDCLREAADDITVQTTLLEARFLAGNRKHYQQFSNAHAEALTPADFFKAKQLEQAERYARFNDTPYNLEPNCKESPGGLRDLHVILWTARAAGLGKNWVELGRNGLLDAAEVRLLTRAETFLRHIRIRLHHLARRREEKLMFDYQEGLAAAFKLERTPSKRASEVIMQRYYQNAKLVMQLNLVVLQNLGSRLFPGHAEVPRLIDENFQITRELIDATDPQLFERDSGALLRIFRHMQDYPEIKGITARTLESLWLNRRRIDAKFRRDPANRALFMEIFKHERPVITLQRMNQFDILGQYLPAFGKIVGQMQHDLFHVYTVDQHIMQVVRNLRNFVLPECAHEYPFCTRLALAFEDYWLLYLAALFHDIAKGRGGDHSKLGMSDARIFCRNHGLSKQDTKLIAFLVEHHLTMSTVAQKQDLGDPDVIRSFAELVKDERTLTALYLLTVADIRGTSPKVWNGWKGKLLEDLYRATLNLLRGEIAPICGTQEQRQEEARELMRYMGLRSDVEKAFWQQLDTVYFLRHEAQEIALHARVLHSRWDSDKTIAVARLNPIGEGLQVVIYTRNQTELFARLCGFFARLGYNIADAKIYTTRHGYALDSFVLLDPSKQLPYRDMISLIEHDLVELLDGQGGQSPSSAPPVARVSRQVKHFPITPEISIRADERGSHYLMSVTAADRPGLLYALGMVLAKHNVAVHTAKINTLGERVEDTFLVSGSALTQPASLVRIEQELLAAIQL